MPALDFAAPALLALALLAPLAAWAARTLWRRRLAADAAWAASGLWRRLGRTTSRRGRAISIAALAVAIVGLAGALARPRFGIAEKEIERRGVDVVFVLDSSLSMAAIDVVPNRLEVAKVLIRRLAAEMPENRLGLVQTEGEGLALSPLTLDAAAIDLMLDAVEPGSLPTPGTELSTGLSRALSLFPEGDGRHRAIVLLSDGEDHRGDLDEEVERLREAGAMVAAIGVGTPDGGPLRRPDAAGDGFKRDRDGQVVISQLNEANLEKLARATGGLYLRATSGALDPAPLVARIRGLGGRTLARERIELLEERFQWPLALAALALLIHLTTGPFAPARSPARAPR